MVFNYNNPKYCNFPGNAIKKNDLTNNYIVPETEYF